MHEATALLSLMTETSLHAGAGSSVGGVDLPIQREGHNGWPCVFGSAVKGALRDRGEACHGAGSDDVFAIFGPDTAEASEHAGAVSVGDARLLLLPVRSLTSSFRWVTCPEALRRLERLAGMLGVDGLQGAIPDVREEQALTLEVEGDLFLEEYRFRQSKAAEVKSWVTALAGLVTRDDFEAELGRRLTIVSDDMFAHLVGAAIPVNPHIALDSASKTVRKGALWYEETLPPETLLYSPLMASGSRRAKHKLDAREVLGRTKAIFAEKEWLQVGGNETVGMGWCAVAFLDGRGSV